MTGWHHQCKGHELGQTLEDGEGQGSLVCYSSWSHEESDTTQETCMHVWLGFNLQEL